VLIMFDFLEEILNELKDIPGMHFLRNLHAGLQLKHSRITKRARELNTRRSDLARSTKNIRKITTSSKGAKRRET
jgi:hypothetical protein